MDHWNIQSIVRCYDSPVDMVRQVMEELSAYDLFNAKTSYIDDLERTCRSTAELCRLARLARIERKKQNFVPKRP